MQRVERDYPGDAAARADGDVACRCASERRRGGERAAIDRDLIGHGGNRRGAKFRIGIHAHRAAGDNGFAGVGVRAGDDQRAAARFGQIETAADRAAQGRVATAANRGIGCEHGDAAVVRAAAVIDKRAVAADARAGDGREFATDRLTVWQNQATR